MKKRFVLAYQWMFGGTKAHAEEVYYKATPEFIKDVIAEYERQCCLSFYYD